MNRIPKDKSLMKIISCKGDNFKIWDYGEGIGEGLDGTGRSEQYPTHSPNPSGSVLHLLRPQFPYVQSLPSPTSHLVRVRPVLTLPFTSLPYGPLRSLLNHYLPNPLTSRKWSLGWVGRIRGYPDLA